MIVPSHEIQAGGQLACDICVIGAGPAGIVLACELETHGFDIVLLEAGNLDYDVSLQEGLAGTVANGSIHPPPEMYRRHMLGGATTIWGGRCVPLDPIDLLPRSYVPNSGWPISWEELESFYPGAIAYCEAGDYAFQVEAALGDAVAATIDGFADPDLLASRLERFSPPTNFGTTYRNRLKNSQNIKLVLQAKATCLREENGIIASVDVRSVAGRGFSVKATQFILAMGGLETTRLLMVSDTTGRGGLGNQGGALGRFYMCHVENTLGRLKIKPATRPIVIRFERTHDGVYVRRKFTLSPEAQQQNRLLNTTARFHYPLIADPSHNDGILSMIYLLKDSIIPEYRRKLATIEIANRDRLVRDRAFWMSHLTNVTVDVAKVTRFSVDWLQRRTFAKRKLPFVVVERQDGCYPLDINAEQVPDRSNTVTLSHECDASGMRRLALNWRLTEQDIDSLIRWMRTVQISFARSGCAQLEIDEDALPLQVSASTPVGGHHLGTARMSDSPLEGVVDKNCRVHGLANLHVASGAVFPTCGHANPTLTIIALAIRLAKRLGNLSGGYTQGTAIAPTEIVS